MRQLIAYLVWFSTGEYEDRESNVEKVFLNQRDAEIFVEKQNAFLEEENCYMHTKILGNVPTSKTADAWNALHPEGPRVDYTGAAYSWNAVPIEHVMK